MDATELVEKLKDFLEKNYYAQIAEKARKGEKFLSVSFPDISQYEPEIADYLLDQPDEGLKAAEIALSHIETQGDVKGFTIRISKLPESHRLMIRNIRSKHLDKFYFTEGIVRQKSDVRPQVTAAKFECPSCGNMLSVLQLDTKFKEPTRCS
ncbi:minichromosome maintenance protein MCM, partial [Candidatus Woesearchaeota archaeon]|nr:minichromosome maintenance protein MCM [Candidatus Woesearchaeota archaeon]